MNTKLLAAALSFAGLLLSGCALTTDQITIKYVPQQNVAQVTGASNVSVSVNVVDQRQDKTKVSTKKNGFGMEMAPIVTTEDVPATIRHAIEKELQDRGFQLGAEAAQVQIAAEVSRFYNDHKTGFFAGDAVADLNLEVVVKSKGGSILYTRQVNAQGIEPNTQLMTGNNAMLALDKALANGMKDLFDDHAFIAALVESSQPKTASTH